MDQQQELPLGTTETYVNMHKWLRRALWVCLTALVIEGTLTFPLAMIWMGWPTLTLREVCDEMGKTRWSDDDYVCIFPYPLFEKSEAEGQKTAKDTERDYFLTAQEANEYGIIDRVIEHR